MPLQRFDIVDGHAVAQDNGRYVQYIDVFPLIASARELQVMANEGFVEDDHLTAIVSPALPLLERMAETYRARRSTYGASEQKFAELCLALFPVGLTLQTKSDWVRFGLFVQMISKLARYANDFYSGHIDSAHDIAVYSAMLEAEDRRVQHKAPFTLLKTDLR